jgi:hypothetical protein
VSANLYDELLPAWMSLQWAIRDYKKELKKGRPILDENRALVYERAREKFDDWTRLLYQRFGPDANIEWDHEDDQHIGLVWDLGGCTVQGVLRFNPY